MSTDNQCQEKRWICCSTSFGFQWSLRCVRSAGWSCKYFRLSHLSFECKNCKFLKWNATSVFLFVLSRNYLRVWTLRDKGIHEFEFMSIYLELGLRLGLICFWDNSKSTLTRTKHPYFLKYDLYCKILKIRPCSLQSNINGLAFKMGLYSGAYIRRKTCVWKLVRLVSGWKSFNLKMTVYCRFLMALTD